MKSRCSSVLTPAVLLVVSFLHPSIVAAADPIRVTVSRETTFATEPKKSDGTLDFEGAVEALQKKCSLEDNAAGPLLDSLARSKWGDEARQSALMKEFRLERRPGWVGLTSLDRFVLSHRKSFPEGTLDSCIRTPWDDKDQPLVAEWVAAMEAPLKVACTALDRKGLYCSVPRTDKANSLASLEMPHAMAALEAAKLSLARAMRCIRRKDAEGAARELDNARRFALLVDRIPCLIFQLAASMIDRKACEAEVVLAASGLFPPEPMRLRAERLHRRGELASPAAAIDGIDRLVILQSAVAYFNRKVSFRETRHSSVLPESQRDADESLRFINGFYDRVSKALKQEDCAASIAESRKVLQQVRDEFAQPAKWSFDVGRLAAKEVLAQLTPAAAMAAESRAKLLAQRRFAVLALLIEAAKRQTGGNPRKLESVLDTRFRGANLDPLDAGRPLAFRATSTGVHITWFGPNGSEDNPLFNPYAPTGGAADDLTLRLGDGAKDCDEFVEAKFLQLRPWAEKFIAQRDEGVLDRLAGVFGKRAIPRERRWKVLWRFKDIDAYARCLDAMEVQIAAIRPNGEARAIERLSGPKPTIVQPYGVYLPESGADHEDWNRALLRRAGIDAKDCSVAHFVSSEFEWRLRVLEYAKTPVERNCRELIVEVFVPEKSPDKSIFGMVFGSAKPTPLPEMEIRRQVEQ